MACPPAIVYLDESCLVNDRTQISPGGTGGLIEVRSSGGVERQDFSVSDPNTTNNRMALTGAITVLQLLDGEARRPRVLLVSDSEYLVRGIREWVPNWVARGWRRKAGAVENLELWQALTASTARFDTQFTWVRGHVGHPKNEYVDALAVQAAREQQGSGGVVPSGFLDWLAQHRAVGQYLDYDPDATFAALERRLIAGERLPLRAGA